MAHEARNTTRRPALDARDLRPGSLKRGLAFEGDELGSVLKSLMSFEAISCDQRTDRSHAPEL